MKRCSTSLIIREMQTKATVRYHLTQVRMAIIKKSTNHKWWRGCGKNRPLLHCWWERKLVQPLRRTIQRFLTKHTLDPEARLGTLLQYLTAFLLPFSSSVSFWMSLQPPGESKKRPWLSISRIFECGFTAKIYYALIWLVAFCFESGGWWRWQSLLLGILHYYRNKWIFFWGGDITSLIGAKEIQEEPGKWRFTEMFLTLTASSPGEGSWTWCNQPTGVAGRQQGWLGCPVTRWYERKVAGIVWQPHSRDKRGSSCLWGTHPPTDTLS